MTTLELLTYTFNKTFSFSGRASRKELWIFSLFSIFYMLMFFILVFIFMSLSIIGTNLNNGYLLPILFGFLILLLPTTIPLISLMVRRLHDLNKSGWFSLIFWFSSMIPIIGPIIGLILILILNLKVGTDGNNNYGPPND